MADPIGPDRIRSDPIGSAADPPRTKSADYSPGGGEEERSKGGDDEEKRMRVEEEGRRREILGDAGSRNPSRSSVGVEEEEREEGEV